MRTDQQPATHQGFVATALVLLSIGSLSLAASRAWNVVPAVNQRLLSDGALAVRERGRLRLTLLLFRALPIDAPRINWRCEIRRLMQIFLHLAPGAWIIAGHSAPIPRPASRGDGLPLQGADARFRSRSLFEFGPLRASFFPQCWRIFKVWTNSPGNGVNNEHNAF